MKDIGFTVYNFGRESPCIFIVTGFTKNDFCCTASLLGVIDIIRDEDVRGSIKIVPIANEILYKYGKNIDYLRGIDKVFPGRGNSIASSIAEGIWNIARECNYVIELKCLDNVLDHIVIPIDRKDYLNEFINAIPIETIVMIKRLPKRLFYELSIRNVKSLRIILRGGKEFEANDIDRVKNIIISILRNMGVIKKKLKEQPIERQFFNGYTIVRSRMSGVFIPMKNMGDFVDKDDIIGSLNNDKVISPVKGRIIFMSRATYATIDRVLCVVANSLQ